MIRCQFQLLEYYYLLFQSIKMNVQQQICDDADDDENSRHRSNKRPKRQSILPNSALVADDVSSISTSTSTSAPHLRVKRSVKRVQSQSSTSLSHFPRPMNSHHPDGIESSAVSSTHHTLVNYVPVSKPKQLPEPKASQKSVLPSHSFLNPSSTLSIPQVQFSNSSSSSSHRILTSHDLLSLLPSAPVEQSSSSINLFEASTLSSAHPSTPHSIVAPVPTCHAWFSESASFSSSSSEGGDLDFVLKSEYQLPNSSEPVYCVEFNQVDPLFADYFATTCKNQVCHLLN
jgi:hypothetical protein